MASSGISDLVANTFTCINALVTVQDHDVPGKIKLRENLLKKGLATTILELKSRPNLPLQIETQLNSFEDNLDVDISFYTKFIEANPEELFMKLLKQVKGSAVYSKFVSLLQHLLLVSTFGQSAVISWDMIDKFVQCTYRIDKDTLDINQVWKVFSQSFQKKLEDKDDVSSETSRESTAPFSSNEVPELPKTTVSINIEENQIPVKPPPPIPPIAIPPPPGGGPPPPPGSGPPLSTKPVIIDPKSVV